MPTRRVERNDWQPYFDRVSRALPASDVDVEVDGLDLGAQPAVDHLPLQGLSYDPHDDAFSIVCDNVEHRIARPREIWIDEDIDQINAIEIVDHDDHKHIAKLTRALALPPAKSQ